MKIIIDRFEGIYAVCEKENREMINIKRSDLPVEAKEGDVLHIHHDKITIDVEETNRIKSQIEELTKDLWE